MTIKTNNKAENKKKGQSECKCPARERFRRNGEENVVGARKRRTECDGTFFVVVVDFVSLFMRVSEPGVTRNALFDYSVGPHPPFDNRLPNVLGLHIPLGRGLSRTFPLFTFLSIATGTGQITVVHHRNICSGGV
jgi:hypothetical protein